MNDTPSQSALLLRRHRAEDEQELINLHNQVFGSAITLADWEWKYKKQPQGESHITVAEIEGEIAGQRCMMRNDLNVLGRRTPAAQAGDSLVRPDLRGQGIFVKLAENGYEWARQHGLAAVFNFPGRNSYPAYVRHLQWVRICTLSRYSYRLGYRKIWGSLFDRSFKFLHSLALRLAHVVLVFTVHDRKTIAIHASSTLPEDLEPCLKDIRDHEVLAVWKDLAYLRWRYENHPSRRYCFHVLSSCGKPMSLIVTTIDAGTVSVCEVLDKTRDVNRSALLLLSVMRYYARSNAQTVEFFGRDDGFFDTVFETCRFRRRRVSNLTFGVRVLNEELREMCSLPHNWTVSLGDTHVI